MTVDEKALQAAIPVGSNIADAHLVRAIIEAYESAKGGAAPARWEFFQDEGYFGMWCVRQTGESRFGEGFHVVSQEEARALCSALSDIRKAME